MSRRAKADVKANVADKYARLKELRKNKETNLQDYQASQIRARNGLLQALHILIPIFTQVTEEAPIFDLVPEDEFNSIAKRIMLEDDFIVDDNGEGYAVGGLEDWDAHHDDYSDEDFISQDEDGDTNEDGSSKFLQN